MIWIATVVLLFVAAWLFFNGLNEKRWVEAHSHDETVASDQGLFAGLAAKPIQASNDVKLSIDQENTAFSRAVERVKRKSARLGDYVELKVQQARVTDDASRAAAAESNAFERMATTVKRSAQNRDEKLREKLQHKRSNSGAAAGSSMANDEGMFDVMVRKVSGAVDSMKPGKGS